MGTLGILDKDQLQALLSILQEKGYKVIGPKIVDNAITYDEIRALSDLPEGYTDEQEKGTYRIKPTNDKRLFGFNIGARSWKQFLFQPRVKQFSTQNKDGHLQVIPHINKIEKLAFFGVRACELNAIQIQDKVFNESPHRDLNYSLRRDNTLIVATNCSKASATCFCVSMKTGPEAKEGFDLCITEILNDHEHYFLCEAGSELGDALMAELTFKPAEANHLEEKAQLVQNTETQMGRQLDTHKIKEILYENHDHPHWEDVGNRCVNCTNCTLACPTCFCSSPEDVASLDGTESDRYQVWDSCFSQEITSMHNHVVRESSDSRYRQWMTHKLASWIDQFGTSGCVGCGRCITWCPVGIDITEEYKKIKG